MCLHAGSSGGSKTCPRRRARPPADLPRRCPGKLPATLAAFPGVVPAEIPPGGNPGVVPEAFRLRAARPLLFPILSRCSPAVRRAPTRFPGSRHESPLIRRDPPEVPTPAPLLSKNAKPGGRRYGGRRKGFSVPSAALSRPFRRDSAPPSARHLRKPERHVSVLPCVCRRKKPSAGDLFRTAPGATPPHAYRMPGGPALRPFPALFRTKKARHSVRNIGRRRSIFRSYSRCARRSAPSRGESSAGAMSNTVFAPVSPF